MVKKAFAVIFFISISSSFAQLIETDSAKVSDAVSCADSWLKLVDKMDYAESWDETATFFKSKISQDKWILTLSNLKPQFGKTNSRKLILSNFTTSLPGAPDGEYVVIQYKTNFELKNNAVETIVPMKDKDGRWRISGYYIK